MGQFGIDALPNAVKNGGHGTESDSTHWTDGQITQGAVSNAPR